MAVNDILYSHLNTLQFVPIDQVLPPEYHVRNRNLFLFRTQLDRWQNKDGYCNPVQVGDNITLQFITHSLDPLTYTVYNSDLTIYAGPTNLDTITAPYPALPLILWQKYIDTAGWSEGCKFIVISATTGDQYISECMDVRTDHPNTVLLKINNSFNTQQMVFKSNVPFIGWFRVCGGYDNNFIQQFTGKDYVDQLQNVYYLNEIPYEIANFHIVNVPDYVAKKVGRYLRLDNTTIEGEGFIANIGSSMERVFTPGAPKKIYNMEIRPRTNNLSTIVNGGVADMDVALMIAADANDFGPNQTNASGSADPVLIELNVTP